MSAKAQPSHLQRSTSPLDDPSIGYTQEFREELSRNPKQKVAIMDADKPQNYKIGAFLSAVETSQLQG